MRHLVAAAGAALALTAAALLPLAPAAQAAGTPPSYVCQYPPGSAWFEANINKPGGMLQADSRFAISDVWVFGDSISARCTWEFMNQGFLANGVRGAFWVRGGMRSDAAVTEAINILNRTGKAPRFLVWALGSNDTHEFIDPRQWPDETGGDLRRLYDAYTPRGTKIIWINTYRGGEWDLPGPFNLDLAGETKQFNAYTVAQSNRNIAVVDWWSYAHARHSILKADFTHPIYTGTTAVNGAKQYTNLLLQKMFTLGLTPR